MEGITKYFGSVCANDRVDLEIRAGTVYGLLGENGAGKSTLMNVLYGLVTPDAGRVFVRGREVIITSPKVAMGLGIGMVHQHFMLVRPLTVVENVVLGLRSHRHPLVDLTTAARRLAVLSEQYGLEVDPWARVSQLSVGQQQRVEILSALYRGADILILDEPTAVLTPRETTELFRMLRRMRDEGKAVVFISHRLEEVLTVTDTCTVMRDGRVVGRVDTVHTSKEELARMMVGRDVMFTFHRPPFSPGPPVLVLERVTVEGDRGRPALQDVTLEVRAGEILGVAGVDGNGQQELCEVATGLRSVRGGKVWVSGRDLSDQPPSGFISAGVAYIPADRQGLGLAMNFSVMDNFYLKTFCRPPFSRYGLLRLRSMESGAASLMARFGIRAASPHTPVRHLSGGNQQKVVLARELGGHPQVIVAHQPTRGLDVGATEYVRQQLLEERGRGAAVLLVSSDLDEIWQLSDRIAVIHRGQIMGVVDRGQCTLEEIGLMMAGSARSDTHAAG